MRHGHGAPAYRTGNHALFVADEAGDFIADPETPVIPHETQLQIGSLLFEGVDQIDLSGPFEVLSGIPNATYRIYGKTTGPVRDLKGLRLAPDAALAAPPQLDVPHLPGGFGQEALMKDTEMLTWIRQQAAGARVW